MKVKNIVNLDFVNYKLPSVFIAFPYCSFKCEKECGEKVCQNSALAQSRTIEIPISKIVNIVITSPLVKSVVFGGLEPFDSFGDMVLLIKSLREKTNIDIVIYSGYNKEEISKEVEEIKPYNNIIIKYGRFIPNSESKFDEILGVKLASNNQYAERI